MIPPDGHPVSKGQSGLVRAALFAFGAVAGRCPRCGASGVFAAPAAFAPRCRGCGLDLAAYEPGPRALYPVVLPLVVLLALGAVRFDDALHPPLWLHALIWPPVVALVMIGALRLVKVTLLTRRIKP